MGWLWMCLGVARDKSARRIGGRVSSETYLAPQYDPTKTPRIEDFLGAGCDISEKYLTGGQKGARRCESEYGPYWGYAEDHMGVEDFVSIEFPRAPGARKSFSELLIETDTLDKGPLALAAMAAAAERAVRSSKLQPDGSSKIVTLEAVRTEPAAASKRDQQPLPSIASLSKDHLEASNAVAAFRESRRQSSLQQNSSYISTLFRSSRKRSLPTRSRSFQRPLSPVPEVLSLEEELRNRRKSDVSTSTMRPPSSLPATSSKQQRGSLEWDDYVLVDRAPETILDAATSSIDARISSSSPEAASQDDATSSSPLQHHTTSSLPQRDASSSVPEWDASSSMPEWDASSSMPEWDASSSMPEWDASSSMPQSEACSSATKSEGQHEDESLLRTPVRDPLVTPEVFISPKTTPTAELNFTRVTDMEPEERLIFGSLADHWEAAWATKRPAWDGKGIPNSTNKYREDQKVMWHAAPFEERLAQALASQQDSRPRRRNSFNGRTSRLAASTSDTSLQAH